MIEKCVVANDFHIPYEDKKVVRLWFEFLTDFQPDTVVINGDLIDCWELSKFDKDPRRGIKFKEEIEKGEAFFAKLREILPKAHLVYVYGNHEFRLQRYIIKNAAALIYFNEISIEDFMHLKEYDVEVVNSGLKESYYKYGDLYISHFNKVSKHAGYTAKALVDDKGVNVMQAHTHRFGLSVRRHLDNKYLGGWENGCMCDLSPNYVLSPNWCHGWSVVYRHKEGEWFRVEQCLVIKYKFFYGGKEYSR